MLFAHGTNAGIGNVGDNNIGSYNHGNGNIGTSAKRSLKMSDEKEFTKAMGKLENKSGNHLICLSPSLMKAKNAVLLSIIKLKKLALANTTKL